MARCNCGKKNRQPVQFAFTDTSGNTTLFNTEVEAKAAKIRAGGGEVKPA